MSKVQNPVLLIALLLMALVALYAYQVEVVLYDDPYGSDFGLSFLDYQLLKILALLILATLALECRPREAFRPGKISCWPPSRLA